MEAPRRGGDRIVAGGVGVGLLAVQEAAVRKAREIQVERADRVAEQAPLDRAERRVVEAEELGQVQGRAAEVRLDAIGQDARRAVGEEGVHRAPAAAGAEDPIHRPPCNVGVDPFVEPRLLELVRGHDPVPVLMPEFVQGHLLGGGVEAGHEPGHRDGEQHRVLHAASEAHRQVVDHQAGVGVRHEALAVVQQALPGGLQDARRHAATVRLVHVEDLDRRGGVRALRHHLARHERVRVGDPGEVVHVRGPVGHGPRAVGIVAGGIRHAGRLDEIAAWHGQGDVEGPEVGEELGVAVERIDLPAGVGEDRRLREPLHHVVVLPPVTHAVEGPRQPGLPGHLDPRRLPRTDGGGQRDGHHRLVDGRAAGQVGAVGSLHREDLHRPPAPLVPHALEAPLREPVVPGDAVHVGRGGVGEGIGIEVELEVAHRGARVVAVHDALPPAHGARGGIERRLDGV